MRHVPDGTLRRRLDEPRAVPDAAAAHAEGCERCRVRQQSIAETAARVEALLSPGDLPLDVDRAWQRFEDQRLRPSPPPPGRRSPRRPGRPLRAAAVAAVAGVVVVAVAAAATLTTVFAPTRVAPVTVHRGDLQAIAGLLGAGDRGLLGAAATPTGTRPTPVGVLHWSSTRGPRDVASLAAAQAASGLTLSLPRTLPTGVGASPRFGVQSRVTATITLGESAGRALAGRTLSLTAGPAAIARYGSAPGAPDLPTLAVLAMQRPTVTSTGATTAQLVSFLLAQPGFPADLAQEIRLLGDLGGTLPVPAPAGTRSSAVEIGGSPGVLIADPSGAASALVWEDRGQVVHVVAGLLDREDVLSVARQLG